MIIILHNFTVLSFYKHQTFYIRKKKHTIGPIDVLEIVPNFSWSSEPVGRLKYYH